MKIKEIGSSKRNLLERILENRGIHDIDLFINPTNENDTNFRLIKNITKAIKLVKENIHKSILLVVDSDCDGFTSSSLLYQYLKFINPNADIVYFLHKNKSHGLTEAVMNCLCENNFDLIIIPDAGTNDVEEIAYIYENLGAEVLVIDHHPIEKESEYGVIINNHGCENTNNNLTGAGLTYMVCMALEDEFQTGRINEIKDLAMVGLVGDGADLIENEVRRFCLSAITDIHSDLLKTFYRMKGKEIEDLTIKDLSFSGIIPAINSVIRIGTMEEKDLLFKALANIDSDYTETVIKRKLNKETRKYEQKEFVFDLYELAVDMADRLKSKQNNIIKKIVDSVKENNNSKHGIFIHIEEDSDVSGILGLLANKFVSTFQKPAIACVLQDDGCYYGSLRGYEKVLPSFKKWCLDTGLFEWVQGHDNASGVCFHKDNLDKILEASKFIGDNDVCHYVDKVYEGGAPIEDIRMVDNYRFILRSGIEEPTFAIKNLKVKKADGTYSKNTMKFKKDGVTYIKFFTKKEDFENIFMLGFKAEINLNLIVKFSINEYNGRLNPQAEIVEIELAEDTAESKYGIFA